MKTKWNDELQGKTVKFKDKITSIEMTWPNKIVRETTRKNSYISLTFTSFKKSGV